MLKGAVPMSLRGELWAQLIGNDMRINPMMFQTFKCEDFTFGRNSVDIKQKFGEVVKLDQLMKKDIPRTFPHLNKLLEEVHSMSQSLVDVLGAFQNFRPDVGYVQGMCYLSAILLIH